MKVKASNTGLLQRTERFFMKETEVKHSVYDICIMPFDEITCPSDLKYLKILPRK